MAERKRQKKNGQDTNKKNQARRRGTRQQNAMSTRSRSRSRS
jgi:hypothetical protein